MVTRAVNAYFQGLQDFFNPFGIYFDTIYTPDIEDYKLAMSSYNLRQGYNFDKLKASYITEDLLASLRTPRKGGGIYNALQYKFSPLKRSDMLTNNEFYYITYAANGKIKMFDGKRNFREITRDQEMFLQAEYEEFLKTQPDSPMVKTLHDTIAGDVTPKIPLDNKDYIQYQRMGVYCDLDIECRFITTNTSLFEDFQILYNARLCDVNPPIYMKFKHAPDVKYPITTRYSEIDTAERLDPPTFGNLTMIGFNVTISTMFLSSYVRQSAIVNRVEVFTEIQPNK